MCPLTFSIFPSLLLQNDGETKSQLMAELTRLEASCLYEQCCRDLKWSPDTKLLSGFKAKNKESLAALDAGISDAEENLGESEVREALLKKAEFLAQIGDKEGAVEAVRKTNEKTVGLKYFHFWNILTS